MRKLIASLAVTLIATPALATPLAPVAVSGAEAIAGAAAGSQSGATGGSSNVRQDGSNSYAGALGQSPSAINGCGKDNRFGFGLLQWSDFSDKCFNYNMAIEAENRGDYERANAWVRRADGIE